MMPQASLYSTNLINEPYQRTLSINPGAFLPVCIFAEKDAKLFRFMGCRPRAAINEVWLGPRLAIDCPRRQHGNRRSALRGVAGSGIHNMRVPSSFGPEEFLVTSGG